MSTKINPKVARRLGVRRFDASEYLRDEADIAAYLEAAATEDDPGYSLQRSVTSRVRAECRSFRARRASVARRYTDRSPPRATRNCRR